MENYKEELRKLRKSIRGYQNKIAKELGVASPTVSRILNGDWDNYDTETRNKVIVTAKKYVKIAIDDKKKGFQSTVNALMK